MWNCLCSKVAAVGSAKQAVGQALCRSRKPTELSSWPSGNVYHTESWRSSRFPEDCAHGQGIVSLIVLNPKCRHRLGTVLEQNEHPINGKWHTGIESYLSVLERALLPCAVFLNWQNCSASIFISFDIHIPYLVYR